VLAAEVRRFQAPAVEAVPVGRVLHWVGGEGFAPKTCIRGYAEFPIGYAQLGPWKEGEPVYTHPPAKVEAVPSTIKCKDCLDTGEQIGVYGRIKCGCKKAIEAVPVAHMRVMVGCRAPDDCEEYLDVCKPDDVGIDGKAFPVYMEPPALDDKKHQRLLSENARLSILNHLYNQIADGRTEFSAMDMDYWDSSHDKLLEAMQNKLDDDTRKLVLELCRLTEEMTLPHSKLLRKRTIAKEIMKKLVAGDE
jgi:hypothetical protein